MPMRGSRRGRLRSAHLIENYGARVWVITYTVEEAPGEIRRATLAVESVYSDPRPSDNVIITFINGRPSGLYHTD